MSNQPNYVTQLASGAIVGSTGPTLTRSKLQNYTKMMVGDVIGATGDTLTAVMEADGMVVRIVRVAIMSAAVAAVAIGLSVTYLVLK